MRKRASFIRLTKLWGIIFLAGIGVSIIAIDVIGSYRDFNFRANEMRTDYIASQKQIAKQEVHRVVDLISYEKAQSEKLTREKIKSRVYEAYAIAGDIYQKNKSAKNKADIGKMILGILRSIRFENKTGYYFVIRTDGMVMLNANKPELEGKNLLDLRDTHGKYFIKKMIGIGRQAGEGFDEYYWVKPGVEGNNFKKISFIKIFKPCNWIIGAGLYVDDVKDQIKTNLLSTISRIRFGKEGYIFINRLNGDTLVSNGRLFSGKKKLWEVFIKNPQKMKDIFEKEYNAALKPEGGYIYYSHIKLTNPNKESPKASFVCGIPDLKWLVGAGVYLDDVEADIALSQTKLNNQIKAKMLFFISIVIGIIALFFLFFNWLSRGLKNDFRLFVSFFKQAAHSNEKIDRDPIKFIELDQIAEYANKMLEDRKQAEEELRESEELYREFIEGTDDLVTIVDKNLEFTFVNQRSNKIFGLPPRDCIGLSAFKFIHPDDIDHTRTWFDGIVGLNETSGAIENRQISQAGEIHYMRWTSNFHYDSHGNLIKVYGIANDITEKKRAEEALRESESRYSALFTGITDAVLVHHITEDGAPGQIIDVNEVACNMLGYARNELIGMGIGDIDAPESTVDVHRIVENLKAGRNVLFEQVHITKDGRRIPVEVHTQTFEYKNRLAILSTVRDITERRLAEEALRQSEEKYRQLFETMMDAYASIDMEGNILETNTSFNEMLGYTPKEVQGLTLKDLTPKKWHAFESDITEKQVKVRGYSDIYVKEYTRKNGTTFPVELRTFLLRDKQGNAVGMWAIVRDISDREKLQSQLLQAQKMESLGTLAGGNAHDFNNILFPIMGFAEMALDDAPEDSLLRKNIEEILHGTMRAGDLVKQILAFSRQSDKKPKPLRVQLVVKEALKLIRSTIPTTIKIKQDIDNDCSPVMADTTPIHQVAMNLMTNAYHAMEDDGGVLEVILKEVELSVDDLKDPAMTPGTYVCLTISDTGVGIPPYVLNNIFEPYFTTKTDGKGTGLGLAVVHGIVKSYGGEIKVYSEPGKGSTFNVYFQAINSRIDAEKTHAAAPGLRGTERILLVDDEEAIVRMEQQMLERLGYNVTARTSSIEALAAFRNSPKKFDLVITDMTMPNMTGVQLAQKLLEINPEIPIIICTGFSTKISDEKAKAFGIRGFAMKPLVQSEFTKKIREVLSQN